MTEVRLMLRQLRNQHQLSQEELARALNTSRQSIISLERGEYLPSFPVLVALIEFFGCDIDDLVDGINIKRNEELEKGGEQSMQLAPLNPLHSIDRLHEEMNEMVERAFGRADWSRIAGSVTGAMNIHETDTQYELDIQAPGFTDEDINIEIAEDTLTISGSRKQKEEKVEGKNIVRREWEHAEFSRSIRFASPIKEEAVEAKLENGLLHIVAPKVEPVKPKTTKIKVKKG